MYKLYKISDATIGVMAKSSKLFIDMHELYAGKMPPYFQTEDEAQEWLDQNQSSNTKQEYTVI
jgi:hypothetical protein